VEEHSPHLRAKVPTEAVDVLLDLMPPSFEQKLKEMGFEVRNIVNDISQLGPGKNFTRMSEGTKVVIHKEPRVKQGSSSEVIIKIRSQVGMRFSLRTVNNILRYVTLTFRELRGAERYLQQLVQMAENLPPGVYLEGTDGYKDYEIELR
jgi:hypothetical protein